MSEATRPVVLQLLPNDHPPFADIATTYRQAFESLGVAVQTLILAPSRGQPVARASYLNLEDLNDVRAAGRALRERLAGVQPLVAVCHRYRAYRILRASGLTVPRVVAVAHEFGFFKRLQRRLERALFARRTLFAGVSPAVQAELGEVVEDPLCLPNALDLAGFDAQLLDRDEALAGLGVAASDTFTIGLVGRLVEKKAPELAIEALEKLVEQQVAVRMLVVGDGPLAAGLKQRAAKLPVIFCGFVPDARRLFRALDVLLLTSEEVEAFGMVALEAMCSRVPVVAGPTPGPQFVLGSSGYYYTQRTAEQVAAALRRVREDAQSQLLADRLEHARERAVREFSVTALARRLDDLFFQQR